MERKYRISLSQLMAILLAGILLGINGAIMISSTNLGFPTHWLSVPTALILTGLAALLDQIMKNRNSR
jgi:hypothetical protein